MKENRMVSVNYKSTKDILQDASRVLLEEAYALQACAERLQTQSQSREGYEKSIEIIFKALDSGGKVVVTGVGKSGKIGEKIVATMLSTGTNAVFLHPVEALHGDLGVIQSNDVVLALSFSGNTEELLSLVPSIKRRQVPIIGMGGNNKSRLAKECQAWLDAYVDKEAGELIPAPTTSTTLALALGDALALSLAKLRLFSTDGFALNHPGGSLGRRLLLKVADTMMTTSVAASVSPQASLDLVIMEMTKRPKAGGVIVVDSIDDEEDKMLLTPPSSIISDTNDEYNGQVVGVITHGDIHRILKSADKDRIFTIRASDIMTKHPIICHADSLALDALKLMTDHSPLNKKIPLLPVVTKDNQWQGVVTLKDLQDFF
ncbi:unnamed protein product [Cunninghamella echinulata]